MKTVKQVMSRCQIENISPVGKELSPEHLRLAVGGLPSLGGIFGGGGLNCGGSASGCTREVNVTTTNVMSCDAQNRCSWTTKKDYDCGADTVRQ